MRLKTHVLTIAAVSAIVAASPAWAQQSSTTTTPAAATASDRAADSSNRTNDIVVTAQFRSTKLQDTPIAITAVNGAMLDQRGQTDIAQVAAEAPNVTLTPQPQLGGIGLIAFIRGVGQTDFDYALEPGVGIYVDDVYIPTLSSSLLNLMDVDRVEILRGPQGTLAGKNSIGGAIKLYSQKPSAEDKGYFEVGYGSYNEVNLRGMANFALTDNLFVRASGTATTHNGWIDMVNYGLTHPNSNVPSNDTRGGDPIVGKEGSQNLAAGRIALRWQPASNLDINISGDYTSEHDSPGPEVLIAAGAISSSAASFDPFSSNPATNANGGAWLPGKNGQPVPIDCHFVPYGAYSCDTTPKGVNAKYITYANFLDGMAPTSQAPFKPYAALQDNDYVGWGLSGNVQLDLGKLANITWISSYRQYQSNFSQDQDASPVAEAQLDNQLNHKAWSQELRVSGELGDKLLEYTAGGFIMHQDASYTARVDLNYAGIDFLHGPDTTPSTSKALFLNATLHPTSKWSVSGGVRYSWDKKVYTYYRRNPDGTIPFNGTGAPCEYYLQLAGVIPGPLYNGPTGIGNSPNCLLTGLYGVSGKYQGQRLDWRGETDYRFSDAIMTYASVATGYMGGGVNPRPFFGPSAGECNAPGYVAPAPCDQIKPFNPETLTTYELGFKSDLFDRRLRINGAVFFNKFNDIILTLSACPSIPCIEPANIGKANVKGAELEVSARPVDGLTLDGSLSYIDFKYNKASVAAAGLTGTETSPFTPEWTGSIGAQYEVRMENTSRIGARFDGTYQSKVFSEVFNSPWGEIPGRFIGNGRIYFKSPADKWEIALEVRNLFDKYYFLTKSDITTSLGEVTGQPGMPRTWLVSLRRNF